MPRRASGYKTELAEHEVKFKSTFGNVLGFLLKRRNEWTPFESCSVTKFNIDTKAGTEILIVFLWS